MKFRVMEIALKEVSFHYQTGGQDIPALVDVSLTVRPGEWLAVIGAGGSGKSTLAQIMAGLLRPSRGQVYLDGVPLWRSRGKGTPTWRGRIGLALQQPERQLFAETVGQDVAFGPRSLGLPPQEVERRVRKSLRSVGLDQEVAGRSPFSLSGGQQRRVALAGILALEPEVFILDEPTAGLDPAGRNLILQVLKGYHRRGNTVIFISHNMAEVAALAQRIAVLHQGRLVFWGSPGEAFDGRIDLARWGLRPPPITEVFLELRHLGAPVSSAVFSLEAAEEEILRWYRSEGHDL
ncbi:MAG: energy-coupling factor transporter ATPase [Thermoanaerobacteraceae bacterium]|nr:energy-coupling factor transporter ATPase [Thermoanaerobacteraceae bacterium]